MAKGNQKNAVGRPSSYTKKKAEIICLRLSEGESLRTICRDKDMPDKTTVLRWLSTIEEFRTQYTRAKELGAEAIAEEILDIADDGSNDWMEKLDKNDEKIGWQLNGEHVKRSHLRIEARKWILAKLAPKKYGDKQNLELSGVDGKPIQHDVSASIVMTPDELAKLTPQELSRLAINGKL